MKVLDSIKSFLGSNSSLNKRSSGLTRGEAIYEDDSMKNVNPFIGKGLPRTPTKDDTESCNLSTELFLDFPETCDQTGPTENSLATPESTYKKPDYSYEHPFYSKNPDVRQTPNARQDDPHNKG
jgi:hypothetical protein